MEYNDKIDICTNYRDSLSVNAMHKTRSGVSIAVSSLDGVNSGYIVISDDIIKSMNSCIKIEKQVMGSKWIYL